MYVELKNIHQCCGSLGSAMILSCSGGKSSATLDVREGLRIPVFKETADHRKDNDCMTDVQPDERTASSTRKNLVTAERDIRRG